MRVRKEEERGKQTNKDRKMDKVYREQMRENMCPVSSNPSVCELYGLTRLYVSVTSSCLRGRCFPLFLFLLLCLLRWSCSCTSAGVCCLETRLSPKTGCDCVTECDVASQRLKGAGVTGFPAAHSPKVCL